jgi:fructose 1,6-bisphosphate aldolase/phosphatase
MKKTTISLINADIGSFPGHSRIHPVLLETAYKILKTAEGQDIIDSFVTHCGDNLELIMTHNKGVNNAKIHGLAWDVFKNCTDEARKKKLYGVDKHIKNFSSTPDNIRGMGPGVAEMDFEERKSDPVLCFMSDKTEPGACNYYLYKIFADPFNTSGLILDKKMRKGFTFEVLDVKENKTIEVATPEQSYRLLTLISAPSRYVVKSVFLPLDDEEKLIAASISVPSLSHPQKMGATNRTRAETKDEPVMIVRAQNSLPAVGEILEPFANPIIVAGWMRGSHYGPFMPVGLCDANCTRFDGPPRVICMGFQVAESKLIGPVDMFDDPAFDHVRQRCNELADILRVHGPFIPHRRPFEDMNDDTAKEVWDELKIGK